MACVERRCREVPPATLRSSAEGDHSLGPGIPDPQRHPHAGDDRHGDAGRLRHRPFRSGLRDLEMVPAGQGERIEAPVRQRRGRPHRRSVEQAHRPMGAVAGRLPIVPRRLLEGIPGEHRVRYAERFRLSGPGVQPGARAPRTIEAKRERPRGRPRSDGLLRQRSDRKIQ